MTLISDINKIVTIKDLVRLKESLKNDPDEKFFPRAILLVEKRHRTENSPLTKMLLASIINAALYHYVGSLNVLNIVKLTKMHGDIIDLDAVTCTHSTNWLLQMSTAHTKDLITRLGWHIDWSKGPQLRLDLRKQNQIISALERYK